METLLIILALLSTVAPTITTREPGYFGYGGGGTLYISGKDFAADQFSQFDPRIGNQVYLVNEAEVIDCKVITYLTTTTKIACSVGQKTNVNTPLEYEIKVFVDGEEASGFLTVSFYSWGAPKLTDIWPPQGHPKSLVTMDGWLQTDVYFRINETSPLDTGQPTGRWMTRSFVGGVQCDAFDENGILYGLTNNKFTCLANTTAVGPFNGTVFVTERGSSVNDHWRVKISGSTDTLYQHFIYPVVTSVSPLTSAVSGGRLLTITGEGFNIFQEETKVKVGEANCRIKSVSDTEIKCYAPRQDSTTESRGERGFLYEIVEGQEITDINNHILWNDLSSQPNYYSTVIYDSLEFNIPISGLSSARLSGHLNLKHEGRYYLKHDVANGNRQMFIALDGNPSNVVPLSRYQWFNFTGGVSPFVEIRISSSTGLANVSLTLADFDTKFNTYQSGMAGDEQQKVLISLSLIPEIQKITVSGTVAPVPLFISGMTSDPVDLTDPNEACFAIKGEIRATTVIRFYYYNVKSNIYQLNDIEYAHEIASTSHAWTFSCINAKEVAEKSWINNYRNPTSTLKASIFWAPVGITGAYVYIDEFMFSSSQYTQIQQTRPSALNPSNSHFGHLVSNVEVSSPDSDTISVKWISSNCFGDYPLLGIAGGQVNPSLEELPTSSNATFTFNDGQVQIERLQVASRYPSGTWDLHMDGVLVSGISVDIEEYPFQLLLEMTLGYPGYKVDRQGTCDSYSWLINWIRSPGLKEVAIADISNIEFDGTKTVAVQRTREGKAWHSPIRGDLLSVCRKSPYVTVSVSGVAARNTDDFMFTYDSQAIFPSLTSATISGDDGNGHVEVTLTGADFTSSNLEDYSVLLNNNFECIVTSVTLSEPSGTAEAPVILIIMPGITSVESSVEFNSVAGGYSLYITGNNFPKSWKINDDVLISDKSCKVVKSNTTFIECLAPVVSKSEAGIPKSVEVHINEKIAIKSDAFTYHFDPTTSPEITSVNETVFSVTGGNVISILGNHLGSSEGIVTGCQVISWSDAIIECVVKNNEPKSIPFEVFTASGIKAAGVFEMSFLTPRVTAASGLKGSSAGGTIVKLVGERLGNNCSLVEISLGERLTCQPISCSENEITCKTKQIIKSHIVRNKGTYPDVGKGFLWNPQKLVIYEGETVTWVWSKVHPLSQPVYNIFKLKNPSATYPDVEGFNSGEPTQEGAYSVLFPSVGRYYYSSDYIFEEFRMNGLVEVASPDSTLVPVSVKINKQEAIIQIAGETSFEIQCPPLDTDIDGCTQPFLTRESEGSLQFNINKCMTPRITSVIASTREYITDFHGILVKVGATLTITGEGFGSENCQNTASIGKTQCTITSSSANSINCTVQNENSVSLINHAIQLTVYNRGNAYVNIFDTALQVTIVPVVKSFHPMSGSVEGGTKLTILGSGLKSESGIASVYLGTDSCTIIEITSAFITCLTPVVGQEQTVELSVTISQNSIPALTETEVQMYNFSLSQTPSINSAVLTGTVLTITGANFNSETENIRVQLLSTQKKSDPVIPVSVKNGNNNNGNNDNKKCRRNDKMRRSTEIRKLMQFDEAIQVSSFGEPFVFSERFSNIDTMTFMWGDITKTGKKTFEETVEMGVWKFSGTKKDKQRNIENVINEEKSLLIKTITSQFFDCEVINFTATEINCQITNVPSGVYSVYVTVEGLGDSSLSETVSINSHVYSIYPSSGSIYGGTTITINGEGFQMFNSSVNLDGQPCNIIEESVTFIKCVTQSHANGAVTVVVSISGINVAEVKTYTYLGAKSPTISSILPVTVTADDNVTITGEKLFLDSMEPSVTFGAWSLCEVLSITDTSIICKAPDVSGGVFNVVVNHSMYGISNSIQITYDLTVVAITPNSGGANGGSVVITGTGFDPLGKTSVAICGDPCPVRSGTSEETRCIAGPRDLSSSPTELCDVTVTNLDGLSFTLQNGYTYDNSVTPIVTSVSPKRGGTAGGTTLTITGTQFELSGNDVTIDGSPCTITSESATSITCVTESHGGPGKFSVHVNVPGVGLASTNEDSLFSYVDRWSSPFTWGGGPLPVKGDFVVIDEGQTVYLDTSTDVLKVLLIKGGQLVFDPEATTEIILRAEYILIVEGGSFSVGSVEEPFPGEATIELYGSIRSLELPLFGAKVLAVRNGTLDLHGQPVPTTWTHLAQTANPGDSTITLKIPVTWKAGDKIVIASTEYRFFKNENEVHKIQSVSEDGLVITLSSPLQYEHISIVQTIAGRTIETRGEVGLLSRKVRVVGKINDDFTEAIQKCDITWNPFQFEVQSCFNGKFGEEVGSDQFGATIMLFGKYPNQDLVTGRIEYVEITEAGQAFQLGRYPIHYHLVGNVSTSYVKGCAIHRTYNRAVTIHAADYLTVEHNVLYDNMGHSIFTEDGVEQFNVIQYNLAIYTRTSSSLLNVDVTPASYWVVNPNNVLQHNAAAAGTHFGFWYRLEKNPSGPSFTASYCPFMEKMGTFANNTAHSFGRYGLWIFSMDGYFPKSGICGGPDLVATWHDFVVWRCERGAEIVFGRALQFQNFIALDNEQAGMEMVEMDGGFGLNDGPGIFDSLVIGYSALTANASCVGSGIIAPKRFLFTIKNVTFVNFDSPGCTALSGCSQCRVLQGGYLSQTAELNFVNSPNKMKFKWTHETVWIDTDGTLTGKAPESVIVPTVGYLPSQCTRDVQEFSINAAVGGSVCVPPIKFHRFTVASTGITPSSLIPRDIIIINQYGNDTAPYKLKRLTYPGWMGLLYSGGEFELEFDYTEHIANISYKSHHYFLNDGDYYYIKHDMMQTPDGFSCYYPGCTPPTLPPISTGRPDTYYRWSNYETWNLVPVGTGGHPNDSYYGLPKEYDSVTIPAGMWMVVDTEVPRLRKVYVYGVIEFEDSMDHVFSLSHLFIQGGSVIAGMSEDEVFNHKLRIVLRGTHEKDHPDNEEVSLVPGTPSLGWKAIGVFGSLTLHGKDYGDTWVKLGITVAAGESSITLSRPVTSAWSDKQIVISTTSKEAYEAEIRTVLSVSENGLTLSLDSPLLHEHIAVTHSLSDGSLSYTMAASVGLLSRNIVIEGEDYPELTKDSFGGRVLVSKFSSVGIDFVGSIRLLNVEFLNMGQEGWVNEDDPRYSLAFYGITNANESYVRNCSFNKNFNTAIGIFGSGNVLVADNVVYHTVGNSIIDIGHSNTYLRNLVTLVIFPGTYNGRFEENTNWFAGFQLNFAIDPLVKDNVVAGAEQAGYQYLGELCDNEESLWANNEAHSVNYGVMIVIVDSLLGVNELVYNPVALDHAFTDKTATAENLILVGASPSHSCDFHNSHPTYYAFNRHTMWERGKNGGNTGIIMSSFMSQANMAPKHPFHPVDHYPAIRGGNFWKNITFANYANQVCGDHVAIATNADSDDCIHPTFVSELQFLDTLESNKVYMHEPNLETVNPADCVDMDCDGLKKAIIQDIDGSLTGAANGTVVAVAEFEWDGDPRRGTGDYRIPNALRMNADGSAIPAADKFPNKGIIRDSSCVLMEDWRAWKCSSLRHRMMIIESMDGDTEIRRLSPIAIIGDPGVSGYVDLLNGPMDRGWCFGYTCQERISTFYSIVAPNHVFEMAFTSTPPQVLRLQILHSDKSEKFVLKIFHPKMQRFDFYVDETFIPPTNIDNSEYPSKYKLLPEDPANPTEFYPTLSSVCGSNFIEKDTKYLHVTICGDTIVQIKTTPTILLSFGLTIDPDNFFEENVVSNLAALFGIPAQNIVTTKVIRENTRRKRSSTESAQIEFEISSAPRSSITSANNETTAVTGAALLTYNDLMKIEAKMINCFQSNGCEGSALTDSLVITSVEIAEPISPPETSGPKATEEEGSIITGGELYSNIKQKEEEEKLDSLLIPKQYEQPSGSALQESPSQNAVAFEPLPKQPVIVILGTNGSRLSNVGHPSDPWLLSCELISIKGKGKLVGQTEVEISEGAASFSDLALSQSGEYSLAFSIVYPTEAPILLLNLEYTINVAPPNLKLLVTSVPNFATSDKAFTISFKVGMENNTPLAALLFEGYSLKVEISLKNDLNNKGKLKGITKYSLKDSKISEVKSQKLRIIGQGTGYRIVINALLFPGNVALKAVSDPIDVWIKDINIPPGSKPKKIALTAFARFTSLVVGREKRFAAKLQKTLMKKTENVLWQDFKVQINKRPFAVGSVLGGENDVEVALNRLANLAKNGKLKVKFSKKVYVMKRLKVNGNKIS